MTTDIAVVERKGKQLKRKPQPKKLVEREQVVMARNPEELSVAQQQMVVWADNRLADARDVLRDLEAADGACQGHHHLLRKGTGGTAGRILHRPELPHRRVRREDQEEEAQQGQRKLNVAGWPYATGCPSG